MLGLSTPVDALPWQLVRKHSQSSLGIPGQKMRFWSVCTLILTMIMFTLVHAGSRWFTLVHGKYWWICNFGTSFFYPGRGCVNHAWTSVNHAWTTINMRERPLICVNDNVPKIVVFLKDFVGSIIHDMHPDSILGCEPYCAPPMARTVSDALHKAAERARRRVELEVAKNLMERSLGYEIADAQFEWISVLSHVFS